MQVCTEQAPHPRQLPFNSRIPGVICGHNPWLSFITPSALPLNPSRPKPQPTKAHVEIFLPQQGPPRDTRRKGCPGQDEAGPAQPGPGAARRARLPPRPPRACSCPLGRHSPPSGTQPGLTVTAAAAAATRGLLLAPASPDHAPPSLPRRGWGRPYRRPRRPRRVARATQGAKGAAARPPRPRARVRPH